MRLWEMRNHSLLNTTRANNGILKHVPSRDKTFSRLTILLKPIATQCHILTHQRYIAVENIVRKGETDCNKQFLLFSQCFLPYMAFIFHFKMHFKMSSAVCFNLDQSKFFSSGNGLKGRKSQKKKAGTEFFNYRVVCGLFIKRLTLSQTTKLRLFQTEKACRRQFQI